MKPVLFLFFSKKKAHGWNRVRGALELPDPVLFNFSIKKGPLLRTSVPGSRLELRSAAADMIPVLLNFFHKKRPAVADLSTEEQT
jgi:hypothetical protein